MEERQDRTGQGERQRGSEGAPIRITDFLKARITEDEVKADEMATTAWYDGGWAMEDADRLRKDCAAKRAIIGSRQSCAAMTEKEQEAGVKLVGAGMVQGLDVALKSLAAVYSHHPDYRQEWALNG